MSLFKVTVHKKALVAGFPRWTNVYHVEALGPSTALDAAQGIADVEKAVLADLCVVDRLTAQLTTGGSVASRAVNIGGLYAIPEDELLPLFNTVRVVLSDDLGRPESKYLRACLGEVDVVGFKIGSDSIIRIQTDYSTPLLGILGLRGPNGEGITAAAVQQAVQMRQVSWHRRTRPGFHRGYVANS